MENFHAVDEGENFEIFCCYENVYIQAQMMF